MPKSRWGVAIAALLHEKDWTQKQLAERAKVRPNTLTTIIRHGGETDTKTLKRIAQAFKVDVAELLMSSEQRAILLAHEERVIERITDSVMKQIGQTVKDLVRQELEQAGIVQKNGRKSKTGAKKNRKRTTYRQKPTSPSSLMVHKGTRPSKKRMK